MAKIYELSEKTLQDLKDGTIQFEDLDDECFVYGIIHDKLEIKVEDIIDLLNNNICSFQQTVDRFKNIKDQANDPSLYILLKDNKFKELINDLIKNNKLLQEDLKYLLTKIDNEYEVIELCRNTSLIKHILSEFVLDKETVDKLSKLTKNVLWHDQCREPDHLDHLNQRDMRDLFDVINHEATHEFGIDNKPEDEIDKELLELNELNRYLHLLHNFNFDENQKLEFYEVLKNSETSQNTLMQIVENHLEDTYDFKSLKNLLTKDTEKKKLKMNF